MSKPTKQQALEALFQEAASKNLSDADFKKLYQGYIKQHGLTQADVSAFQKQIGAPVDGKLGPGTLKQFKAVNQAAAASSAASGSNTAAAANNAATGTPGTSAATPDPAIDVEAEAAARKASAEAGNQATMYDVSRLENSVRGNTIRDAANISGVALQAGLAANAMAQIGKSNKGLKNAQAPLFPGAQGKDPNLQNALYQANLQATQGLSGVQRQLLNNQNQLAYNGAQEQASAALGSQAGAYAAASGANSLNRMRANMEAEALSQQVAQQAQQGRNQLLGLSQQENQQIQQNRQLGFIHRDMPLYENQMAALTAQGQAGRTNLYNSLTALPRAAQNAAQGSMLAADGTQRFDNRRLLREARNRQLYLNQQQKVQNFQDNVPVTPYNQPYDPWQSSHSNTFIS
jgi:hypothetical protein